MPLEISLWKRTRQGSWTLDQTLVHQTSWRSWQLSCSSTCGTTTWSSPAHYVRGLAPSPDQQASPNSAAMKGPSQLLKWGGNRPFKSSLTQRYWWICPRRREILTFCISLFFSFQLSPWHPHRPLESPQVLCTGLLSQLSFKCWFSFAQPLPLPAHGEMSGRVWDLLSSLWAGLPDFGGGEGKRGLTTLLFQRQRGLKSNGH